MTVATSVKAGEAVSDRLEISELRLSEVRCDNAKFRLDSGYFANPALTADAKVRAYSGGFDELGAVFSRFVKGIFDINADSYSDEGVPFLRILNLRNGLIDESNLALIPAAIHKEESKTELLRGQIVLSKTAYPAASLVTLDRCNTSQDTIATTLSEYGRKTYKPEALVAYLNSEVGLLLLQRQFQGNVQLHLSLDDGRKVPVPRLGQALQDRIARAFNLAEKERQLSLKAIAQAETRLAAALGLQDWSAPEPLTYVRKRRDVLRAGRLDSQFFAPRVESLLKLLGRDGLTIGELAPLRREKFEPKNTGTFNYIEIGSIEPDGTASATQVQHVEAPSRASQIARKGDVISSTVRPIRRLTALIAPEHDGYVCSSGFVILKPEHIKAAALFTYMRLPLVCELMDLYTSASMYPAISERDLLSIPIPNVPGTVQDVVELEVRRSRVAKARSMALLKGAIQSVELALSKTEEAARAALDAVIKKAAK